MEDVEATVSNFLKGEVRRYAGHEAGHAVVAHQLGGRVVSIALFISVAGGLQIDGETNCCGNQFTTIEDLAVRVAGCGAEHLLGARTPRTAKEGDRKRMRERLLSVPQTERSFALAAAYHLADKKLMAHGTNVCEITDELTRRWSIRDRVARIEGDELKALLDG